MTIFVSIANYRDSQTPHTVHDLLNKAKFRNLITVGVLSQINKETDAHCLAPSLPEVVQEVVDYKQGKGVCWARSHILTKMRKNQTFVLQIDSHTRFSQDWDETLIKMIYQCGPNPVLTAYPEGFQPPANLNSINRYLRLAVKSINEHKVPIIGSEAFGLSEAPAVPEKIALYSGNFSFTYGSTYDHVPYDPHIYFLGEETVMAVRLYTAGYNLYAPNKHVLWHQYNIDKEMRKKDPRPLHWGDNNWGQMENISRRRIQYLLGIDKSIDPRTIIDLDKYGLGKVRTLNEYQNFAGIYFKTGTLEPRALTGNYRGF